MSFLPVRKKEFPTINLFPFVDCLMVIVAYLLLNAVFISPTSLTVYAGRPSTEQGPANLDGYLNVQLHDTGVVTFSGHTEQETFPNLPAKKKGELDADGYAAFLKTLPRSYRHIVLIPTRYSSYGALAKLTALSQRDQREVVLSGQTEKGI